MDALIVSSVHGGRIPVKYYRTRYQARQYAHGHKLLKTFDAHDDAVEFAARQQAPGAFVRQVVTCDLYYG